MSMLGISLLNEIVINKEIMLAYDVLNELRKQIKLALQQTGKFGEFQDGMDIAFCSIDTTSLIMSFAGAHNSCWIIRNPTALKNYQIAENEQDQKFIAPDNLFIILEADHMPAGVYYNEKSFTEKSFQLKKDDIFYIFSDGYFSQFGGTKQLPLRIKKFKNIIIEICDFKMDEQKQILENKFEDWRQSNEQTDDILIIGIKI